MKNLFFQCCDTQHAEKTNLTPATAMGPDDSQNRGVALTLGRSFLRHGWSPSLFHKYVTHPLL